MSNIKNFDKLKTEEDRKFVETWSKITTVTINDDGLYMLDIIPYPATQLDEIMVDNTKQ